MKEFVVEVPLRWGDVDATPRAFVEGARRQDVRRGD
jgi:hypothetical protein